MSNYPPPPPPYYDHCDKVLCHDKVNTDILLMLKNILEGINKMIKRNEDIIMIHTQTLSENLDQKTNIITITQNQTKQIISEIIKQLEPIAKIYEMIEPITQYLISPKNGAGDDSVIAEFLKDLEKIDDSINTVNATLGTINNNVKSIGTNITTEGEKIDDSINTVNATLGTINNNVKSIGTNITTEGEKINNSINTVDATLGTINDNLKSGDAKNNIYTALELISQKISNITSYDGENIKNVLIDIKDTISKLNTNEFKFNISENSTLHSALVGNSDSIRAALAGDSGSIKSVISNLNNTIQGLNNSQTNNTELNNKIDGIISSLESIKSTLSNNNDDNSITYKINNGLTLITNQLESLNQKIQNKLEVTNIDEFNTLMDLKISTGLSNVDTAGQAYTPGLFENKKIFDYNNSNSTFNPEFFTNILNVLAYHERIFQNNNLHISQ